MALHMNMMRRRMRRALLFERRFKTTGSEMSCSITLNPFISKQILCVCAHHFIFFYSFALQKIKKAGLFVGFRYKKMKV